MLGEVAEKALVDLLDIIYEFDYMKLKKLKIVNLFLKSLYFTKGLFVISCNRGF